MGSCTRKGRREISPLREGKKHFTDVTSDNLTSSSIRRSLLASQGKVLQSREQRVWGRAESRSKAWYHHGEPWCPN